MKQEIVKAVIYLMNELGYEHDKDNQVIIKTGFYETVNELLEGQV